MAVNTIDPTKPVLGYALRQRIGTGGFGEVWAAEAPGGLPKAVKFVFGYHDEKRAQAELKALNRIRSVRHPFLISLERIDIVEGQMVVITELADMCLKTRFGQCVDSGLNGIPRAELLGYLRDSASALDYISDEFNLQHLDVKPENLLLLSGHIKVADFGLVKDIHDGTQSMMSGLTPAYAPPELFDGRPSKTSDQYSLAILFQEMLTGIRPFDGTTAAQLAAQHMHERPVLKPLPRDDQAIISRALSKDPELRFPSCSAMVDALVADRTRHTSAPTPRTRTKLRDGRGKRRKRTSPSATLSVDATRPFAISPTEIVKLENLAFSIAEAKLRPTLFVGMGKTGTRVLRQIRGRLTERDGHRDKFPAIKFFCVDTDSADLMSSCHTGTPDTLTTSEIFPLPLRRPDEYRNDAKMHLAWLSRRWIYNVPKSLRTEGIRPLGRLAFATHVEDLSIRLRQVLSELVEAEALAKTAAHLDLDPVAQPRVVLVGSISGGTCSGMAIDLAYTIRTILRQLSVLDEDVIGVFTHSTSDGGKQRELAIANSLAFLNELYHFSCVEEYPGDETCGIPPSTDGTTTFASTYLLHLGDDLSQLTYEDEIDSLAEYLYLNSATAVGTFYDTCRRQETESSGLPLRTMGLCRSGGNCSDVITDCAYLLGEQVIRNWTDHASESFDVANVASRLLNSVTAHTEPIVNLVHQTMTHMLKDPVLHLARPLVENFNELDRDQTLQFVLHQALDTFGSFAGATDEIRDTKLAAAMNSLRDHFVADRTPKLTRGVLDVVDAPGPRISGAFAVMQEITNRLRDQSAQLGCMIEKSTEDIMQLLQQLVSPSGPTAATAPEFFQALAEVLLQRFTLQSVQEITDSMLPFAQATRESLERAKIQFELATTDRIADVRQDVRATFDLNGPGDKFLKGVLTRLQERVPRLAGRVEQQLQHNFLDQQGGLRAVLSDAGQRDELHAQFEDATRATIVEQLREISLEDAFDGDQLRVDEFADWMIEQSTPRLAECGGAMRLVYAYPQRSQPASVFVDELAKRSEQRPNSIPATVGELVVCSEIERVPLDNVAMQLFHGRPDSIEFASRLHTRTDIDWTHISSMR